VSATELRIAGRFARDHPDEAAWHLERLPAAEAAAFLATCAPEATAAVLRRALPSVVRDCLLAAPEALAAAASALPASVVANALRAAEPEAREAVLGALRRGPRGDVERLLRFPSGSAGALMDPRILPIPEDLSVAEAVERIRREPEYAAYYLYVIDREQKLVGVLNARDLLLAAPEERIEAVQHRPVAHLRAGTGVALALRDPAWRGLFALPVVDDEGVLLGALRWHVVREASGDGAPRPGRLRRLWRALGRAFERATGRDAESPGAGASPGSDPRTPGPGPERRDTR